MSADKLGASRIESDLLGEVAVPAPALYGAQTYRAVLNFPVDGGRTVGDYPEIVRALIMVKKACAQANLKAGFLDQRRAAAIIEAADDILRAPCLEEFPIHPMHGGGGTSANMNANEVLANLAEERLGGQRGKYELIHPNDHVNLNQSTNDVYPTACHLAVILGWSSLEDKLRRLAEALLAGARKWADIRRLTRTCLQDAVDTTFGNLIGAYAALIDRCRTRVAECVAHLYEVNLGGTIVGRAEDVPDEYFDAVMEELRVAAVDDRYRRADNLYLAAQSPDDLVAVSGSLDLLARSLIKIAKDLRLLASGPEGGLGELRLPAVQPGSSMMPGKVNPVIPEFVIQQCFQVAGKHSACLMALDHGELDLNIWESLLVFNILDATALLSSSVTALQDRCLAGLQIDSVRNAERVKTIIPLLTDLVKQHGYSKITDLCKRAGNDPQVTRELLAKEGLMK